MSDLQSKQEAWANFKEKSDKFYQDGLEKGIGWITDVFVPFFSPSLSGENQLMQFQASSAPPGSDLLTINMHRSAKELAAGLNFLNTQVYDTPRNLGDPQNPDHTGQLRPEYGFAAGAQSREWPWSEKLTDESYHDQILAPLVSVMIADLKIILENDAINASPELLDELYSAGGLDPFNVQQPPDNIADLTEDLLDASANYLDLFPNFSYSLKKDIPGLPASSAR